MPQASESQRALMNRWFGSDDPLGPIILLLSHGYTQKEGRLYKPTPSHTVSRDEWQCLRFLVDEWDFGFIPRGE